MISAREMLVLVTRRTNGNQGVSLFLALSPEVTLRQYAVSAIVNVTRSCHGLTAQALVSLKTWWLS